MVAGSRMVTAVGAEVGEPLPHALPPEAGGLVGDVAQSGDPGGLHRVDQLGRFVGNTLLPGLRNG
jgi:hypothetical protein